MIAVRTIDIIVIPSAKYSPSKYRGADCAVKMKPMAAPAESVLVSG